MMNDVNKKDKSEIIYPSIIKKEASGFIDVKTSFLFKNRHLRFSLSIPRSLYNGARISEKVAKIPKGTPENAWKPGYYNSFIFDPAQNQLFDTLLSLFREIRLKLNLDDDEYLELISAYVQKLPYDKNKVKLKEYLPRFPVETIVDNIGICSDKSFLLASLLSREGYAVSILTFSRENHMAVGISVEKGYDYKKCGYAVIESTITSYIGDTDGEFSSGEKYISKPAVYPIGCGKKQYKAIAETNDILKTRQTLRRRISAESVLSLKISRIRNEVDAEKKMLNEWITRINKREGLLKQMQIRHDTRYSYEYNAYKSDIDSYNAEVKKNSDKINALNKLVNKYNLQLNLYKFITENITNRKAVTVEIHKIEP